MMRKRYTMPEMDIKAFEQEDVIKTSGFEGKSAESADGYDNKEISWAKIVG